MVVFPHPDSPTSPSVSPALIVKLIPSTALTRARLAPNIEPPIGFHQLRHSYASLLADSGVPMRYVAEALGHASTKTTERYYVHLEENAIAKAIRDNAPEFGFEDDSKVVGIR